MNIFRKTIVDSGLTKEEIKESILLSIKNKDLKKVLLIPPDFTRFHSNAGYITNVYYHELIKTCEVDILPALGTHEKMSIEQCREMFGDIPYNKFIVHNWRTDIVKLGEVPSEELLKMTDGIWKTPVSVEVNKLLMDKSYDLIISIGQVVPHEVIGMANHSKNIFVGCGGKDMINSSHMIGALYGMERMMGKDHTPVRQLFDYSLNNFMKECPILFVLTVTTAPLGNITTHGLFIGEKRNTLEEAIKLAQEKNIDFLEKGIRKCIVYLDPSEFKSTWLGNKAVYRTRMAIQDGGELIILGGGIERFGEDRIVDNLIRKYGYIGREKVLEEFQTNEELKNNMGMTAHLIHGSSDNRFSISYAVKNITKEEIESVNYKWLDYEETIKKYNPMTLKYGWNIVDNEEVFFIPNPALGLWIDKNRF